MRSRESDSENGSYKFYLPCSQDIIACIALRSGTGAGIQYSEKGNDTNIHIFNELTSNFHASNVGKFFWVENTKG